LREREFESNSVELDLLDYDWFFSLFFERFIRFTIRLIDEFWAQVIQGVEEVGSQTVGLPYRYQYQQLTPQHGSKMDENSRHSTFQESLAKKTEFLMGFQEANIALCSCITA
jgi:hypothetical protein